MPQGEQMDCVLPLQMNSGHQLRQPPNSGRQRRKAKQLLRWKGVERHDMAKQNRRTPYMATRLVGGWGRLGAPLLATLLALGAPAVAQQASEAQRNAIRQACPADYQAHCANVPAAGQAAFACLQRNMASLSRPCQQAVRAVAGGAAPRGAASSSSAAAPAAPQSTRSQPAGAAQYAAPMSPREQAMVLRQSCGGDYRALCSGVPLGGGRAIACLRANAAALSPQCGQALSAARGNR